MRSCAIFDLDGTIIDRSSEQVFLEYLLERGEIPICNLFRWIAYFIRTGSLRKAKAHKIYLHRLSYDHARDVAETCFRERLLDRISPRVFDLIAHHRSEGRVVVLLSGSLEILVRSFHCHLETDLMIGYQLETLDGYFTGARIGLNPYAENKALYVQELARAHGLDLVQSYAYGNHYSDVHKLALVGNPVAVNPDRRLSQIAKKNGWQIEEFHREI